MSLSTIGAERGGAIITELAYVSNYGNMRVKTYITKVF